MEDNNNNNLQTRSTPGPTSAPEKISDLEL